MESNKAPEKIYCTPTEGGFYLTTIKSEPPFVEGVEYTRTDAFIEKACDYLNKTCRKFILTEKDIEDFKDYMKGE